MNCKKSFTENENKGVIMGSVHLFNTDFYFKCEPSDFSLMQGKRNVCV